MAFTLTGMVANARADVGYREGWNNDNKFTVWQTYGRINHQPYCASGVSKWAWDAGFDWGTDCVWNERGDWNVTAQRLWAERRGLWRSRWEVARPGWPAVIQFNERDQHVGIVERDNGGGQLATIEANTSPGGVFYKTRVRGPDYAGMGAVVGFIAIDEAGQTGPPPVEQEDEPTTGSDEEVIDMPTGQLIIKGFGKKPALFISGGKGVHLKHNESIEIIREAMLTDGVTNLPLPDDDLSAIHKVFRG